ncbi:MAG: hypothetical protein LAT81_12895, partial [Oceanicaulis sp.]|nr:hypothetical protein [Oceanicaulis sp.]
MSAALSNKNSVCLGDSIALSATGLAFGLGQQFQWQISTDNLIYTNILGATTLNYSTSPNSSSTWYRLVVSCGNQFAVSSPVQIFVLSMPIPSGVYTLNQNGITAGSNFKSFKDFVDRLNCAGVAGPVIINVVSGSGPYYESFTINHHSSIDSMSSVRINGNGEIIEFETSNLSPATITINGARFITVDNLVVRATGQSIGAGIWLREDANNIVIKNSTIEIPTMLTNPTHIGINVSSGFNTDLFLFNPHSNTLSNNTIIGGHYGVRINSLSSVSGNKVIENRIENVIFGVESWRQNNVEISNNQFVLNRSLRGLIFVSQHQDAKIFNNTFFIPDTVVSGNRFPRIVSFNNATAIASNPNLFFNNVFYSLNGIGAGGMISVFNTSHWNIIQNTLFVKNTLPSPGVFSIIEFGGTVNQFNLLNNIFYLDNSGSSNNFVYNFNQASVNLSINNNAYYFNNQQGNTSFAIRSTVFPTFQTWQSNNGFLWDSFSVFADPEFANTQGEILVPTNLQLNDIGASISGMTDVDFLGVSRSQTPDPGAFEFSPPPPCPAPNISFTSILDTLISFNILNGFLGASYHIEWGNEGFTLGSGNIDSTSLGAFTINNLSPGQCIDIYIKTLCSISGSSVLSDTSGAFKVCLPFQYDLAISEAIRPLSLGNCWQDSTDIVVVVYNNGLQPISHVEITSKIFGGYNEILSIFYLDTLKPGETDTIIVGKFKTYGGGFADISVYHDLPLDLNRINDTIQKSAILNAPVNLSLNFLKGGQFVCEQDTVIIRDSGVNNYFWNNNVSGSHYEFIADSTKYHFIAASSLDGCTSNDSILVTVYKPAATPLLLTNNTSPIICKGDSILLYSSIPGGNYIWSNGAIGDSIYVKNEGLYSIMNNDSGSVCHLKIFGSIQIQLRNDGIIQNRPTPICVGDSIVLTARDFGFGSWSTGDSTYSITVAPNVTTTYYVTYQSLFGCYVQDSLTIEVQQILSPTKPSGLNPQNGTLNIPVPIVFSWNPSVNTLTYDFFLWKANTPKPINPTADNVGINYTHQNALDIGQEYLWQVKAKNSCLHTESDTFRFTVRSLPDLLIDTLIAPSSAMSGTQISVTYRVKNIGEYTTGSASWNDRIYISTDEDLHASDDILLATIQNLTFLDTGQSYTNTVQVQLPANILSTVFLFVVTDNGDAYLCNVPGRNCPLGALRHTSHTGIAELREDNNHAFDTLVIIPSPHPDLIVQSVGAPVATFSGNDLPLIFTVKNAGQADVPARQWRNCFYYSTDSMYDPANAVRIFPRVNNSQFMNGPLLKDSTRTTTVVLPLPPFLIGTYWFHVMCDCDDNIFEGAYELNNITGTEVSTNITLTPPPDLVVSSIVVPPTGSSGTPFNIQYVVTNQGASAPTVNRWTDSVWMSTAPTFDPNTATFLTNRTYFAGSTPFNPGMSYTQSFTVTLPQGISGPYYFYVKTNARDEVYEFVFNNNNLSRSPAASNISLSPYADLVVTQVILPQVDSIFADSIYTVQWTVKNQGNGPTSGSFADRLFISTVSSAGGPSTSLISALPFTGTLAPGDSILRSGTFLAPSLNGLYFFYVHTDINNQIYEYLLDNNNITGGLSLGLPKQFVPRPPNVVNPNV